MGVRTITNSRCGTREFRTFSIQSFPSTPFLCPPPNIESWLAGDRSSFRDAVKIPFPRNVSKRTGFVMLNQRFESVTPRTKKPRTKNLIPRTYLLTNSHPISKVIRAHDRFHPVNRIPSNGQLDEDQTTRGHAILSSRTPPERGSRRCKS